MARLLAVFVLCLHAFLAFAAGSPAADPAVSPAANPIAIPALKTRVTDLTATLTAAQAAELEAKLADFEARKGSQLAVLILPSTAPDTIEAFAIRLMDAWKIGRTGVDDGVILIVAKDERRLRIEVGYGLEGVLNDAAAKRIIEEIITPAFKSGDLPGGISAGAAAILAAIEQEKLPEALPAASGPLDDGMFSFADIAMNTYLFGFGFLAIGGAVLRYFLGNLLGSGLLGGLCAGLGWLLAGTLVGALIGGAVGFFVALFGFDLLLSGASGSSSGGSGSSSGGSGGGGGGFSGGGGGGGGGGASGSW